MRIASFAVLFAAAAGALMIAASGPGTRLGLWGWLLGLKLMQWAAYVGIAAGAAALVLLAIPGARHGNAPVLIAALVLALVAAGPPFTLLQQAKAVPPIHDITTDFADPPDYVALAAARAKAPNGFKYGGPEVAAAQKSAYPDIQPIVLAMAPAQAFERVNAAARAMKWEVAVADAPSGRLEATDTTAWFGFKDDVSVRVRPDPAGSRVDVRSLSRVGKSDVGANAKRIRDFRAHLQ